MDPFEITFTDHHVWAHRLAYVLTGDATRAEDVVADVFTRLFVRGVDDIVDVRAYLRRAIVNTVNSAWRRLRVERAALPIWDASADTGPDDPAADIVERIDRTELVMAALGSLSPRQRSVLVLRYFEDLSEADIAAVLGISRGTVKSSAARGLSTLRSRLGPAPSAEGRRAEPGLRLTA